MNLGRGGWGGVGGFGGGVFFVNPMGGNLCKGKSLLGKFSKGFKGGRTPARPGKTE